MAKQSATARPSSLSHLAIAGDFILLRMALVDALGGDHEAAIVYQRIFWRCENRPDGWLATLGDLQAETRLSEWKVKKAVKKLRDLGYITSRRASAWDNTPVWSIPPDPPDEPEPAGLQGPESGVIPDQEDSSLSTRRDADPQDSRPGGFLLVGEEDSSVSDQEDSSVSSLETVSTTTRQRAPQAARGRGEVGGGIVTFRNARGRLGPPGEADDE